MAYVPLEASARTEKRKGAARELRRNGFIPATIYGGSWDPVLLKIETRLVEKVLAKESINAIFDLTIDGEKAKSLAMIKELQKRTLTNKLLHMDFIRIQMDQKIQVNVPVEIVGEADMKKKGGILQIINNEILIECLPADIPESLTADISELEIGTALTVADIKVPDNVVMVWDETEAIVSVLAPKIEVEPEEEEGEEGEEGEGEEGGEEGGEAAGASEEK